MKKKNLLQNSTGIEIFLKIILVTFFLCFCIEKLCLNG